MMSNAKANAIDQHTGVFGHRRRPHADYRRRARYQLAGIPGRNERPAGAGGIPVNVLTGISEKKPGETGEFELLRCKNSNSPVSPGFFRLLQGFQQRVEVCGQ